MANISDSVCAYVGKGPFVFLAVDKVDVRELGLGDAKEYIEDALKARDVCNQGLW